MTSNLGNLRANLSHEVTHLQQWLAQRWQHVPTDSRFFERILELAQSHGQKWFDGVKVENAVHTRRKQRGLLLKKHRLDEVEVVGEWFDCPYWFLLTAEYAVPSVHLAEVHAIDSSQEEADLEALVQSLVDEFPTLAQARPHGWSDYFVHCQGEGDVDEYWEEHWEADIAAYPGYDSNSAAGGGVVENLSLSGIACRKLHYGQDVPECLISAIYTHLHAGAAHNRTCEIVDGVQAMQCGDDTPNFSVEVKVTGAGAFQPVVDAVAEQLTKHLATAPQDYARRAPERGAPAGGGQG